jgi:hypothetical protein
MVIRRRAVKVKRRREVEKASSVRKEKDVGRKA